MTDLWFLLAIHFAFFVSPVKTLKVWYFADANKGKPHRVPWHFAVIHVVYEGHVWTHVVCDVRDVRILSLQS